MKTDDTANPEHGYTVYVDDNFHYMDEDERYVAGTFATYEEALAKAESMLRRDLDEHLARGGAREEWFSSYHMFGEDPWISPTPEGEPRFSARDYVATLAREMGVHQNAKT